MTNCAKPSSFDVAHHLRHEFLVLARVMSRRWVRTTMRAHPGSRILWRRCSRVCPTWGKLYRKSHFGKHFKPKKLRFSGLSLGFKSLLPHHPVPQFSDISENRSKSTRVRGFVLPGGPRESSKTALRRAMGKSVEAFGTSSDVLVKTQIRGNATTGCVSKRSCCTRTDRR